MNLKENYLTAMHHGIPEHVPLYSKPVRHNIGLGDVFEKGPVGGGLDGFGQRILRVRYLYRDIPY